MSEPSPDDVFVIAEHIPHWVKNALGCSHSAIRATPNPRTAFKLYRDEIRHQGGDVKFTKLLRRSELLDWAEKNNAKLLLSMEPRPEPNYEWNRRP